MENTDLFRDILLVAAAALAGGAIAQALRLPTIIGFLVAGVAISPNTPGPVGNIDDIRQAADVGVVLLMFGIGIQLSFRQLLEYRRPILLGGGLQISSTIAVSIAAGLLLGYEWTAAVIISFLVVNTSSVVVIKVLEGRRELKSVQGIASLNISILQDLSAVLMVIAVPSLAGGSFEPVEVLLAIAKGTMLIAATYLVSTLVLPVVWRWVAFARSRELSLLAAIVLAVGLAAGSGLLGLSIAFGAFLAGLALSENEFGQSTLSDVIPLRDIFAAVFFLSMGMLMDPEVLWKEATTVLAIVVLIIAGKGLLSMIAARITGLALGTAILAGLILAQVGEFSFVIANTALEEDVIGDDLASAFLVAAVASIVLNPGLVRAGSYLLTRAHLIPGLRSALVEQTVIQEGDQISGLRRHVVICGYGDAAHALVRSLSGRGLPFVVIENNPFVFDTVKREEPDLPFIFGDATRPETLELARVHEARVIALTFPNPEDVRIAALNARTVQPGLDVVARGTSTTQVLLRRAGSSEVVDPEFEASLEFVRHVLHRFGVDSREIGALQTRWRSQYYSTDEGL